MSLLVRPASQFFRTFLTRPNTYILRLPTGSDLYFSLPFDRNWLRPLLPIELAAVREYFSEILGEVTNAMGNAGMHNLLDIRHEISDRLSSSDQLTTIENRAWAAGHGFPVFDCFNRLMSFSWNWNAIHFEYGPHVAAWCVRYVYDFQNKPCFEKYAVRGSTSFEENKIGYDWWIDDGQLIIEWYCNGERVCTKIHGAFFRDYDEWRSLKKNLESYELDMLKTGTARLRNTQSGGWELVVYWDGARTGTHSTMSKDTRNPSCPAADIYFKPSQFSEELTSRGSDSWDNSYFNQTSSQAPRTHTDSAKRIQDLNTCTSHTCSFCHPAPTHHSNLPHEMNSLANSTNHLKPHLFPFDKTENLLPPSPYLLPESLYLSTPSLPRHHQTPFKKHAVPHAPVKLTKLTHTVVPEYPARMEEQLYQAYAEDDEDGSSGNSIRAAPTSWRDV